MFNLGFPLFDSVNSWQSLAGRAVSFRSVGGFSKRRLTFLGCFPYICSVVVTFIAVIFCAHLCLEPL